MTTPFDIRTEQLAEKYGLSQLSNANEYVRKACEIDFKAGRNSARESLEILARALERSVGGDSCLCGIRKAQKIKGQCHCCGGREAIAKVKELGCWPLEETP